MSFIAGGYIPKDAPSPVIQHHSKAETAIVAFTAAVGILSTMFFLLFNIYHRKHQYVLIVFTLVLPCFAPTLICHKHSVKSKLFVHIRYYRVVKQSSYCLNTVILSAILMGFIGTALYTIEPDENTSHTASALLCNVRKFNPPYVFVVRFS